jgi:hypothetical protein
MSAWLGRFWRGAVLGLLAYVIFAPIANLRSASSACRGAVRSC